MKLDWNDINIGDYNAHSIFWTPVEITESINVIKNIEEHSSFVTNPITNKVLKNINKVIAYPIMIIFNKCFSTRIFSEKLKKLIIIPLHKNGYMKLFTIIINLLI